MEGGHMAGLIAGFGEHGLTPAGPSLVMWPWRTLTSELCTDRLSFSQA